MGRWPQNQQVPSALRHFWPEWRERRIVGAQLAFFEVAVLELLAGLVMSLGYYSTTTGPRAAGSGRIESLSLITSGISAGL